MNNKLLIIAPVLLLLILSFSAGRVSVKRQETKENLAIDECEGCKVVQYPILDKYGVRIWKVRMSLPFEKLATNNGVVTLRDHLMIYPEYYKSDFKGHFRTSNDPPGTALITTP